MCERVFLDLWFGGYAALTRSPSLVAFVLRKSQVFYKAELTKPISISSVNALNEEPIAYAQIQNAVDKFVAN